MHDRRTIVASFLLASALSFSVPAHGEDERYRPAPQPNLTGAEALHRELLCGGSLGELEMVWRHVEAAGAAAGLAVFCPLGKTPISWGYENTSAALLWRYTQSHPWSQGPRRGWRFLFQVDPVFAQAIPGDQTADPSRPYRITLYLLCARCIDGAPRSPGTEPLGARCQRSVECASGFCSDGVCCDSACAGTCESCRLESAPGRCAAIPVGTDPDHECVGTSPYCQGRCGAGACAFPDAGTPCGVCRACDGIGRCLATPGDDDSCGPTIDCDGLDTRCRDYHDVSTERCGSFGVCKPPNDISTCTRYTRLCCEDPSPQAMAAIEALVEGRGERGEVLDGGLSYQFQFDRGARTIHVFCGGRLVGSEPFTPSWLQR